MKRQLFRDNRGETLVEVMASILIGTMSLALLLAFVRVSFDLDLKAEKMDAAHYDQLSKAEKQEQEDGVAGTVKIERIDPTNTNPAAPPIAETAAPILVYGDEGMYSYKGE